ncbi:hypothetical protein AAW12_11765 [Sphingobacterium sp. Ag1]|uniref:hypothetical protein n=1 Tax=Sphingobacterium sp. Ag1 TaxID=1643451 RepID=UPI00062808F2|nr:hypothetical protein [Sphingobacterium sp. Ag1]KKO91190.1 hypothetical protein AAW12_11765 [Sphingobacterium sp. Ag1]
MKKGILFLGLVLLGGTAFAQTGVRLNIELYDVQHLVINPDQSTVTLDYRTLADYQNGVESVQKAHLSVFSTSGYEVKVKLANQDFIKLGQAQTEKIPAPLIRVKATATHVGQAVNTTTGVLSNNKETIISSDSPTLNGLFDVTYTGPGADGLMQYVEKNNTVTFTNDVLYSIETR